jgi:hypothetical protein
MWALEESGPSSLSIRSNVHQHEKSSVDVTSNAVIHSSGYYKCAFVSTVLRKGARISKTGLQGKFLEVDDSGKEWSSQRLGFLGLRITRHLHV